MKRHKVSCLCITENRQPFMDWLLWSYDRQTYPQRELIVVDSSMEPWNLARSDVRVVPMPAGTNIPAKRNRALSEACGEFIAWFDDDDWQHPERLSRLVQVLEREEASYAGGTKSFFLDLHGRRAHAYDGFGALIFNTAVFRSTAIQGIHFDESRRKASDTHWLREVRRQIGRPVIDERAVLSMWLSHEQNISNPRCRRRFGHEWDDVCRIVGTEVWASTPERISALATALPAPDTPALFLPERSPRAVAHRSALARVRRRPGNNSLSSSHLTRVGGADLSERRPVRPEAHAEPNGTMARLAEPRVSADLLIIEAPSAADTLSTWCEHFTFSSGCRLEHRVVNPVDSSQARSELAEGRSPWVILARGWVFPRGKVCAWAAAGAQLLERYETMRIGVAATRPGTSSSRFAQRARLGTHAVFDRKTGLFARSSAPTPLWLCSRETAMDWLDHASRQNSGNPALEAWDRCWAEMSLAVGAYWWSPREVTASVLTEKLSSADVGLLTELPGWETGDALSCDAGIDRLLQRLRARRRAETPHQHS